MSLNSVERNSHFVARECFWGDYRITPEDVISNLREGDSDLERLIVSKIIDSAAHPSAAFRVLMEQIDYGMVVDTRRKAVVDMEVLEHRLRVFPIELVDQLAVSHPAFLSEPGSPWIEIDP